MPSIKAVQVGPLRIGGGAPVAVQSMCTTDTRDVAATVAQIRRLEEAGCEVIRLGVPDLEAARALAQIRKATRIPLVADIHFDHEIALVAAEHVDKLRINPGNIGDRARIRAVVERAKERGIPIRIGVNAGSLERHLLERYGPTPEAMVASARAHVALLEDLDFTDIVVSLKASDVARTVAACRMFARDCPYPIHLGVTEAGTRRGGTVKSAIALGTLLLEGIGDTIRISLAEDPVEEVHVAWEILGAIGLRHRGVTLTACPACARASFDLVAWTRKIETVTRNARHPWRIAVMGCVVNGPGEAREADLGIVGGRESFALYRKGGLVRRVAPDELLEVVREEVARLDQERESRES